MKDMKKYSIYLLSMMMTVGCAQELTEPGDRTSREDSAPEFVSTKAVNTSANAIEGMILINLEEKGSSAGLSFESLKMHP